MAEFQSIIDHLNDKPFNKNLSLVSFDSKSFFELIDLVVQVCCEIDTKQKYVMY